MTLLRLAPPRFNLSARRLGVGLLIVFMVTLGRADETFSVFAPDQVNQQFLHVRVQIVGDRVMMEPGPSVALGFAPNAVAGHPDGRHVIVSGANGSQIAATTIEVDGKGTARVVGTASLQEAAGYTSVDRSGRYFLTVHYGSGAVATYALDEQRVVGAVRSSFQTPNKEAHCILTTPDNRFVYIPCVKFNNALYQYAFDEKTGQLSPLEPFDAKPPAMFGPRHVAYHPTQPLLYFSNEQQLGVSVYEIGQDGQLADRQHVTTMPRRSPFTQGQRGLNASSLVLSPDAQWLFVAVRDFDGAEDSVFTFRLEADGKLSLVARRLVGDIPVKLVISPAGRHLVVSESGDNRLAVFAIGEDGQLTRAAAVDLPSGPRDLVVVAGR
jgi:6-phosphogluconolactonase